jgi:hypothetical protein
MVTYASLLTAVLAFFILFVIRARRKRRPLSNSPPA